MKRCLVCKGPFRQSGWQCPKCGFTPETRSGVLQFDPGIADKGDSYNPAWYEELARLEDRNFWFRARNRLIAWLARRHLPASANFLEIGCGTGYVLRMLREEFPGWRITASEMFPDAFPFAARRVDSSVQLQQFDARAIPYRDEFDAIGAFDVIEHIEDDAGVLNEVCAALKPQGLLIASVPQHKFLWSRYDEIGHHFRRYELPDLSVRLCAAGFQVVETTSFNSLLLPLLWLSRKMRKIANDADLLDELRIGGAMNELLYAVLALEFAFVRIGVRWPAGGSRIFVARKIPEAASRAVH